MTGIYKIQSIIHPERVYIGSACNISQRWSTHIGHLKRNRHPNPKLQDHCNKHGIEDLHFSVILYDCKRFELLILEQYFLDLYNPWFNICKIAGNTFGRKTSEETKRKLSAVRKGQPSNFKGRFHTEESKKLISKNNIGNLGRKFSKEVKQKMRHPHKNRIS